MWPLVLLAISACTCVDQGLTYMPYGGMMGYNAYDPYAGLPLMSGPMFMDDRGTGEPELLNCFASYLSPDGRNIANELAVTIEAKRDTSSWDPGMGYMGMGYGGMGNIGSSNSGLTARVELISNVDGGKAYIVFTKTARSDDGCFQENFGEVLLARDQNGRGQHGLAGYDLGAYGMMGYGMDMGMLGYGMGFGTGHHGHSRMFGSSEGEGIVSEINVTPGALTSAVIDNIGFTDLKQLAGRGVLVCSNVNYDWDWKPTCEAPYYSCCSLKYDSVGVTLRESLP